MAYLMHFNRNHSKKNGQFAPGDGDGDGKLEYRERIARQIKNNPNRTSNGSTKSSNYRTSGGMNKKVQGHNVDGNKYAGMNVTGPWWVQLKRVENQLSTRTASPTQSNSGGVTKKVDGYQTDTYKVQDGDSTYTQQQILRKVNNDLHGTTATITGANPTGGGQADERKEEGSITKDKLYNVLNKVQSDMKNKSTRSSVMNNAATVKSGSDFVNSVIKSMK